MRRIGIPVVLALASVALAGTGTPAAARNPLEAGVDCWTVIGSVFCEAFPVGGTGTYVSYVWSVEEWPDYDTVPPTSSYQVSGSSQLSSECTPEYDVRVTVTIRDSGGATTVGNSGFTC